jgi:signal transduction histidine kinase
VNAAFIKNADPVFRDLDDGVGMDDAMRHKVFDPFFTTKMGRGGTGLGLHISYTIVTGLLGGIIEVTSAPGCGTEFVILLPRVAPERKADTNGIS